MVSLYFPLSFVAIASATFLALLCAFTPDLEVDDVEFFGTGTVSKLTVSHGKVIAVLANVGSATTCSMHATDDFSMTASVLCSKGKCTLTDVGDYAYVRCYDEDGNFDSGSAFRTTDDESDGRYPPSPLFRVGHTTFEHWTQEGMVREVFTINREGDVVFRAT